MREVLRRAPGTAIAVLRCVKSGLVLLVCIGSVRTIDAGACAAAKCFS